MSALWSYLLIAVSLLAESYEYDPAQCAKPTIDNVERFSEDNEYYDKYDVLTAWCRPGYYPESITMTCMRPKTSQEWTPAATCKAMCKKPTIRNVGRLLLDQEYYTEREVLSVLCKPGYYPSADTMRCDHPGTLQEWTPPTITCKARCKRPVIEQMLNPFPYKMSYNEGEEVTMECKSGFYPSYDKMRCVHPLTSEEWAPPITCIDVSVMERVTSSSATFRISCAPSQCPNHWRFDVTCCDFHFGLCTTLNSSSHVTFAGLQPSSQYRVTITLLNNQTKYNLKARLIGTEKSDPPQHPENTLRENAALQLNPVPAVNGPISSYDIIVYLGQERNRIVDCVKFTNTPYNSIGTPSHYTAAVLPAETLTAPRAFILGDDQHYNGFHNAPLIPKHNYSVYIRVTSRWNEVEKSSCAFAGVI